MVLRMTRAGTIGEVQADFSKAYPFLRIEFYKPGDARADLDARQKLTATTLLGKAGLREEGELKIADQMTVGELEHIFREKYGVNTQVARQSGTIWLETTMTDAWTLHRQNEHGRELSSHNIHSSSIIRDNRSQLRDDR